MLKSRIRTALKRAVPYSVQTRLKIARQFNADRRIYARYAGPDDDRALECLLPQNLEMQLTKDYHRIEKGLTLPRPKSPFGSGPRERLEALLPAASDSSESGYVGDARSAVGALRAWNDTRQIDDVVAPLGQRYSGLPSSRDFFSSRRSVRNYSSEPVAKETVEEAVRLALYSPSVCNRQAWRAYLFDEWQTIQDALRYQNGNAGFGETIPCLILITVDMQMFAGANERRQPWIDGGLFAMSLVWALHSMGLASCMLNMSQPQSRTQALKRRFAVPENEEVIMFISIGYPADGFRVARSPRRSVEDVLKRPKTTK